MTIYCSLQKTIAQTIPDRTWTTISKFNIENADTHGMSTTGGSEITIPENGVYLFSAKVNFKGGGTVKQRLIRFLRDPDTLADSTGTVDFVPTAGTDYKCHQWPCYMRKGRKMVMQVRNYGTEDCVVTGAQFKATRIA